eukprot:1598140-Rhodomonas_salina.1
MPSLAQSYLASFIRPILGPFSLISAPTFSKRTVSIAVSSESSEHAATRTCLHTQRNPTQETAISAQFVPTTSRLTASLSCCSRSVNVIITVHRVTASYLDGAGDAGAVGRSGGGGAAGTAGAR